jgi:two-component system nitrogen regulation response regulator GlnG
MSAQNTLDDGDHGDRNGAYEYLPKPFDLNEMLTVIGRALMSANRPRR